MCEGIAKTVKALCDAVGLPCIVALSEAAPERGVKYRHTWNVVTVEGQRYHLDATFDNSLQRGVPRYDYFNLDDRHIFRDHEALVLPLPPCTADKGYYYRALSFTKPEDVESRARQALRKKQAHFVFHWCSSRTRETNCKYTTRMFYYRTKPNSRTDGHDTAEERTSLKIN